MATAKNGEFISGAKLDETFAKWFCIQITYNALSVSDVKKEAKRIYEHFVNDDGKSIALELFLIVHQKQLDNCNSNHIHMFLSTNRKMRLMTMINYFANVFGYNTLSISVDKCILKYAYLRYILHLDGNVEGKHTYDVSELYSNLSYDLLSTYVDSEDDTLTSERLIQIIFDCDFDKIMILKRIGLDAYKKNLMVIRDVCEAEYRIRQDKSYSDKMMESDMPF